ncbi:MAG: hypothetical protein M9916_05265 [Crocinitomicaceae bacterium]|nr:hypothetical protein [Crocinitomicaceae bacterium]
MRKTIFSVLALGALSIAIYGCKKKEEVKPTTGEATVEGYIRINSNSHNDTTATGGYQLNWESIPSSVVLTFVVDSKDLTKNVDTTYTYEKIQRTATVAANGKYSVKLPTPLSTNVIDAQLLISAFDYNPIIAGPTGKDSLAARVVKTPVTIDFTIFNGGKTIVDYNY